MFPLYDSIENERQPLIVIALMLACGIVFVLTALHGGSVLDGPTATTVLGYGATPFELTHPGTVCDLSGQCFDGHGPIGTLLTIFTAMFLHGGIVHLAGNMLFLWVFGSTIEDTMNRPRFLAFYLCGGLAATITQVVFGPNSGAPMVGASGAIAAVMGGYLVLYWRAKIRTLFLVVVVPIWFWVPAVLYLVIWFGQQALFSYADFMQPEASGGGVAYYAHFGGFVFGVLTVHAFATRKRAVPSARWVDA